jgi:hypothetical protein
LGEVDDTEVQVRSVDGPGLEKINSFGLGQYVDYCTGYPVVK